MPDIIVHNRMGRTVYKKLPPEISSEIDRETYRLGLLGPDPYALYRFFAPDYYADYDDEFEDEFVDADLEDEV